MSLEPAMVVTNAAMIAAAAVSRSGDGRSDR